MAQERITNPWLIIVCSFFHQRNMAESAGSRTINKIQSKIKCSFLVNFELQQVITTPLSVLQSWERETHLWCQPPISITNWKSCARGWKFPLYINFFDVRIMHISSRRARNKVVCRTAGGEIMINSVVEMWSCSRLKC